MIFLACLLTVAVEVAFFALCGYRNRLSLLVVVCSNVITNLLLNLTILFAFSGDPGAWIALMADQLLRTVLIILRYRSGKWRFLRLRGQAS